MIQRLKELPLHSVGILALTFLIFVLGLSAGLRATFGPGPAYAILVGVLEAFGVTVPPSCP